MKGNIRPKRALLNPDLQRPSALDSCPRNGDMLWLDKNENLDTELLDISREVLRELSPLALATYPEAGELYRKLADWVGVDPQALLLTPGSDGAIRLVFESFVEQGDAVVHTHPTFAMYSVYSQMFGAQASQLEYLPTEYGPQLDPGLVIDAIKKIKPKLFCLPNPDSPSGTVMEPDVLRRVLVACEESGTVFLLDEAYHPFYGWSGVPWTIDSPNLVVVRTFAKAWGVAGLRIGYAVAHPDTIALLHKMRPMYEVSTVAVEFMSKMLDFYPEMLQSVGRIQDGKDFFVAEMEKLGFSVLPTSGNFLHVAFGAQAEEVHSALRNRVLYRVDFSHPSLKGYSRFTVAPKLVMKEVANLIKQAVSD